MPEALANTGFEPTAVMAVPVLVCKNAHIPNASSVKNRIVPVGMTRFTPNGFSSIVKKFARTLS